MSDTALENVTVGYSSLIERTAAIPAASDLAGAELVVVAQTGRSLDAATAATTEAGASAGVEPPSATALGSTEVPDVSDVVSPLTERGARVVVLDSRGVAKSRNEALRQATRKYLLFCDDDVVVNVDGVAAAVAHLETTGAALALGRAVDETGAFRKNYPQGTVPLTLLNSAKAATYEMIVDVEQARAANVWFDERFGAGVDRLYLGDEYIFIADLLRAGLKADAVDVTVAMHPADSSGARWGTDADVDARSAALSRALGTQAWWVKPAFAARHFRTLGVRRFFRFLRPTRIPAA